ncbi:hypothetical protein F66182_7303 [Fusarium sp. NRRL 66182]|nr:hypothetical protein F66182_7303 [Fusarium sp. NRRL 66182]
MSIVRLPAEIISLLVELLQAQDVFNLALSCRFLSYIIYDRRMCRLALMKAQYSHEAREAQSTKDYPRAFRKLAKRRLAITAAEPWMVGIVAMADHFIYTNGHLCYTVENRHLRVLNTLQRTPRSESTVDVPLLLKLAVRDYDPLQPHTFEPLYCSEGILSCLATQVLDDSTTSSWLVIFELRATPEWIVVQRPCSKHQLFVRNNKDYLFWGSRCHTRLDGSYRWGIQCLDLRTRKWSGTPLILWDFDGSRIGSDICFEIIDNQFYCISNRLKTQADHSVCNNFYQAVRFPVDNAVHEKCEKPPMRNLWRRHDSEGAVDERWTSLQLSKDEDTGELLIFETRKEWFPGNAGSQRTCYRKQLQFRKEGDHVPMEPLVSISPDSTVYSPVSEDWDSENHIEKRPIESFHVGDGPTDATAYTLRECFVRSYNPSCESFVDLVCEAYNPEPALQLRIRPKKQASPVGIWPRKRSLCHPSTVLAQLHGVVNPVQPIRGIEWCMDERILVYSPTHMAPGQLRPVILISFDPGLVFPGVPNYTSCSSKANNPPSHSPFREPTCDVARALTRSSYQEIDGYLSPGEATSETFFSFIGLRPLLYQSMNMGNGDAHGFDMSYSNPSEVRFLV